MIKRILQLTALSCVSLFLVACDNFRINTFDHFGAYPKWLFGADGHEYKSVGYRWDYERNALLYVYRPATRWSMDEVEAPSFNVNGKRLFNIKGGSYTWYELEPGKYDFLVRRGIFGIEGLGPLMKTYSDFSLNVKAGKVYYLRYSEIDPQGIIMTEDGLPGGDGPLQLVGSDMAVPEIKETNMMHHGRDLLSTPYRLAENTAPAPSGQAPVQSTPRQVDEQAQPIILQFPEEQTEESESTGDQSDWWPF